MDQVDCYAVLHMALTVQADVCAGARATIRAAEIQAKAARHAGTLTLLVGLLALLAASIVGVWQVLRNAREQENKYALYRRFLLIAANAAAFEIHNVFENRDLSPKADKKEMANKQFLAKTQELAELLSSSNWQTLANSGNTSLYERTEELLTVIRIVEDSWQDYLNAVTRSPRDLAEVEAWERNLDEATEATSWRLTELAANIRGIEEGGWSHPIRAARVWCKKKIGVLNDWRRVR